MSKAKHTPGPWKVYKRGPCGPSVESFWIGKESRNPEWRGPTALGDLHSITLFNGTSTEETAEANAALISAAPDMLEFIEICRTWFLRYGDNGHAEKALEIINKAKGLDNE